MIALIIFTFIHIYAKIGRILDLNKIVKKNFVMQIQGNKQNITNRNYI